MRHKISFYEALKRKCQICSFSIKAPPAAMMENVWIEFILMEIQKASCIKITQSSMKIFARQQE